MAFKPTHGMTNTREHKIWRGMRDRCLKPTNTRYADYGGRGIAVCDEWRVDFMAFYRDMGPCPSSDHSLDRKENDGPYCKANCRWATREEQQQNSRQAKRCEIHGVLYPTIGAASRTLGVHRATMQWRISHNVSGYRVLP